MMKTLYLDIFSGISGDMFVGALADAGANQEAIIRAIASLEAGASVSFEKVKRAGLGATKFHVQAEDQKKHRHLSQIVRMIEASELSERAKGALAPGASRIHIYDMPLRVLAVLLAAGFILTLLVRPLPKTASTTT